MAFDKKPSTWLANWAVDGTDVKVPIATFPEMTAEEAHATTGDIRKVLWAFCEKIYNQWNATLAADRPTQIAITKTATQNVATGVMTNTFTIRFNTEIVSQEVDDEPV